MSEFGGLGDHLDQILAILDFESSSESIEGYGCSPNKDENAHRHIECAQHFRACWLAACFCK